MEVPNSTKIKAAWGGMLAAMCILSVLGWVSLQSMRMMVGSAGLVSQTHRVMGELSGLRYSLAEAESSRRGHALTADERYLPPFSSSLEAMSLRIQSLKHLTADNSRQQATIRRLDPLIQERVQVLEGALNKGADRSTQRETTLEGTALTREILAVIESLEKEESRLLGEREVDSHAQAGRTQIVVLLGSLSCVAVLLGVFLLLHRQFRREAQAQRSLEESMRELAFSRQEHANQKALLQSMIDSMSEGVVVADDSGKFMQFNPAAAKILGKGMSDTGEANWASEYGIFHPDGKTPYSAEELPLTRAIRGFESNNVELLIRNPQVPEDATISVNGRPYRDAQGQIKGGMVVFRDVTSSRRSEERHIRESKGLNDLGDLLQVCHGVEEAYEIIAHKAPLLFPGISGSLRIISTSRNALETKSHWGAGMATDDVGHPEDCWAIRRGQAHAVTDLRTEPVCKHLATLKPSESVCVPVGAEGDVLGVLTLVAAGSKEELTGDVKRLLGTVARQIGVSLGSLRLRDTLKNQSIRDSLTGLYNRRFMEESLERETARAQRSKSPIGLIMIDIDHFKKFNDTYGHEAGDEVLRRVGETLKHGIRDGDIACRYGGEELTVILPGATLEIALMRAEALREAVKALKVSHGGEPLGPVTVSLGIASYPGQGKRGQDLISAADAALYRAKREGRDRVVAAEISTAGRGEVPPVRLN